MEYELKTRIQTPLETNKYSALNTFIQKVHRKNYISQILKMLTDAKSMSPYTISI